MRAHRIPNLRRDLPMSVALLIMAAAAVVPGAIAVIISLSGITGLMFFRLTRGNFLKPRRALRDTDWKTQPERTNSRGGSHATRAA
jgi:hypothetical protein